MHDTARELGRQFFATYCSSAGLLADLGAMDVNGSLREVAPSGLRYVGLDMAAGPGVDVVVTDPDVLPLDSDSVDYVVSSSCFEHAEHFWLLFGEVQRVLKPGGLFYVNVPSNGPYHRYPVDCWRFYPDAGLALERWGRKLGWNTLLLESFIAASDGGRWNDFVAVFVKDAAEQARHPGRMSATVRGLSNVWRRSPDGTLTLRRELILPEDQRNLKRSQAEAQRLAAELAEARARIAALEARLADGGGGNNCG